MYFRTNFHLVICILFIYFLVGLSNIMLLNRVCHIVSNLNQILELILDHLGSKRTQYV
jgi:hypothetical protein